MKRYHRDTVAIHGGQEPDPLTGAIGVPVYQTATYLQDDVGVNRGYDYSRSGNPTRAALERSLAAVEGGRHGLAFASGMAAVDAVIRLLPPGSHVVAGDDLYGGTHRLFEKVFAGYGLRFSYVDLGDPEVLAAALQPDTRLIWVETPTNPRLRLVDIAATAAVARRRPGEPPLLAVDNTFATPYLQNPLALGADVVVHSTTKYLSGHNDVIGGALVVDDPALHERLAFIQNAAGAVPGPWDCWLVLRGIATLPVRMRAHGHGAAAVAEFLAGHAAVSEVLYPGLPSHPGHDLARRQMRGFGGMVSFRLRGGREAARLLLRAVVLITLAESLGGVATLIEYPAEMSHAATAGSPLAIEDDLVRLSVGLEHPADLIADLEQALGAVEAPTAAVATGRAEGPSA